MQTGDSQLGVIFALRGYFVLQEMCGKNFPHPNSGHKSLLAFNSYRLRMILSILQYTKQWQCQYGESCPKITCTEAMGDSHWCFHILFKFCALDPVLPNCSCVYQASFECLDLIQCWHSDKDLRRRIDSALKQIHTGEQASSHLSFSQHWE